MAGGSTAPTTIVTADGIRLAVVSLTAGLEDPTDFAVAADGRIFIAERAGRIRVFRDGRLQPAVLEIDDVVASGRRGLLALALAPDFERTGHIFAAYTAESGFRLVRYRAAGDTLGESATLLDGVDATLATPSATLRFGPDGKLYLGLDDSGDPSRPGDLGSFNGKVLRLNPDGTTPTDQAAGTPVYALNVNEPRGLEWDGATLWVAESLRLQGLADAAASARRATAMVNYRLPAGIDPEGMLFYRGGLIPGLAGRSAGGECGRRCRSAPAVRPEQPPQNRVERVPALRHRRPDPGHCGRGQRRPVFLHDDRAVHDRPAPGVSGPR